MILCCGEALIDMLPRQTAEGEQAFAPHAGGSVFNTARALGRLDGHAGFLSGLSTDLFGRILEEALVESGVDISLAVRSDRPTTLAFVELTDGHARYHFYDEGTAARMLTKRDIPALPKEVEALFFGCISLVAEPCGSTYEALMVHEAGKRLTMVDTNIRPSFVTDEQAYRARLDRMIAIADIVKLSDEDLHWLAGEGEVDDLACSILDIGPALVCITQGGRGVRAYTASGIRQVEAPKVQVVDTVGAGDTFNAGLLKGLSAAGVLRPRLNDMTPEILDEALSLGVRAAAITVSRAGANPPRLSEL